MVLSRLERIVIVVELLGVVTTIVVMQRRASSKTLQSVIPAMKIAVPAAVNLLPTGRSAEQVLGLVILKRHVVVQQLLVLRMLQHLMVSYLF